MIDEEMHKTMRFILAQQAQFAINMQKLDEKRSKLKLGSQAWMKE